MDQALDAGMGQFGWLYVVAIFIVFYFLGLLWQALVFKVWGNSVYKEIFTGRALYFKTKEGEFRIDKTHQKFNYKLKGQVAWESNEFTEVVNVYVTFTNDTASMIEFLLGEWSILDLAGKYRDVINAWTVRVRFSNGEEVPIMTLKQYEQRDWPISQFFLVITIAILRKLGLYKDGENVAYGRAQWLAEGFRKCGLDIYVK